MNILTIDTSTNWTTLGIVKLDTDGHYNALVKEFSIDSCNQIEQISSYVINSVFDSELSLENINAIVVGCGPGSFMELRLGITSAKTLGHSLLIPVYGVCSLDSIGIQTIGNVLIIISSKSHKIYWALYNNKKRVYGPSMDKLHPILTSLNSSLVKVAGPLEYIFKYNLIPLKLKRSTSEGLIDSVISWTYPEKVIPIYLHHFDFKHHTVAHN